MHDRSSPMTDRHRDDELEPGLARALDELRHEEPDVPLRRDRVWDAISRERAAAARGSAPSYGMAAVAAALVLAAGTVLVSRPWASRPADAPRDPLLVEAAQLLRAVPAAPPGSAAADSLHGRSALLLAATRAHVDRAPAPAPRVALLHDVEYVLAQLVEGGLTDAVEHELALDAIRARRLIARVEQENLE